MRSIPLPTPTPTRPILVSMRCLQPTRQVPVYLRCTYGLCLVNFSLAPISVSRPQEYHWNEWLLLLILTSSPSLSASFCLSLPGTEFPDTSLTVRGGSCERPTCASGGSGLWPIYQRLSRGQKKTRKCKPLYTNNAHNTETKPGIDSQTSSVSVSWVLQSVFWFIYLFYRVNLCLFYSITIE